LECPHCCPDAERSTNSLLIVNSSDSTIIMGAAVVADTEEDAMPEKTLATVAKTDELFMWSRSESTR